MLQDNFKIFTNGTIRTMDDKNETVEAVAVRNGVFVEVGSLEACKAAVPGNTEVVDLQGKCMLPGFIELHVHPLMMGMGLLWADIGIDKVHSIPELIAVMKEAAAKLPPDVPVRGFGYDHRSLAEGRQPTAKELDEVASDRPVQIWECSGHCNVVNTYFLNQVDVTKDTPNPFGGAIGRDEDGNPDGSFYDSANDYLTGVNGIKLANHGPNIHFPYTLEECQELLRVAQHSLLENGFTTINDIQVTRQEMETYMQARDEGKLTMRVVASYMSNYLDEMMTLGLSSKLGDNKLSLGALKLYQDGAIVSGTAYSSEPYSDTVDTGRGHLYHELQEMKDLVVKAHSFGLQMAIHTQGDAAHDIILEALEEAERLYPGKKLHHRLEHSSYPTEAQVKKMAELDVWPNPQPQNFYDHGEGLVKIYKNVGGTDFIPFGWHKKYGVPILISSDAPVSKLSPIIGMYMAITRRTAAGNIFGPEHRISVDDAVKAYTITAAQALHREETIGSIEVGKLADMVVLSQDPYTVGEEAFRDITIDETWIDGERVFTK